MSAQDTNKGPAKADVRFILDANARLGSYSYAPEQWGELHLRLENSSTAARDLLCTTYFGDQSSLQFGRQLWLPARSRLSLSHPVLIPTADQVQNNAIQANSLVIDRSDGGEVLLKSESGQLRHDRSLLVFPAGRHTGFVIGWGKEDLIPQDVVDLVVASRVNQSLNNKFTVLSDQFLPADETSLRYLDHLVVAENRLLDDEAGLTAVRRWLHAGGRLWIMLDRTDPLIVERLLGDEFQGQVLDRTELTAVRIDIPPTLTAPEGQIGKPVEFDQPVAMARLVVEGMDVHATVDGWPAALTRSVGEGRLMITTLGARGWYKPKPPPGPRDPLPPPELQWSYVPNSAMEDLGAYILAKREEAPLPAAELEPLARELVSYQVPGWTLIVGTMAGFLVSLLAVAVLLQRLDVLEHFGWIGSLLAVIFGVALTGIGVSSRYGVPGTEASVQLAQAISGTDDIRTRGVIALYRPEEGQSNIRTAQGGELWPDMTGLENSTRRMITTDLGTFHWDGLPQPVGLRAMTETTSSSQVKRIEARATLDAQGLVGEYVGHPTVGSNAVLATRSGRISVTSGAEGQFTAPAEGVLEADQYLDATFLGDEQDRRRRIFQQLFSNQAWKNDLNQPQLLIWVQDWNHGFQFGEGLTPQGETLLVVPVELTRPPAGTEIVIPSPLLSFVTRRPPDGSLPSGFWNDVRHEWQERSGAATTWLSFQIPPVLLPLAVTKARLNVKVSGPAGRIEILGVKQQAAVSLETVNDPVGSLMFEIDDADVLSVSDHGALALGLSAGQTAAVGASLSSNAANWKIESLTLQLWARTADRTDHE